MTIPQIFEVYNFKHYPGANPYLGSSAVVFDFRVDLAAGPLSVEAYCDEVSRDLPRLQGLSAESYTELFAKLSLEISKLDMELYVKDYRVEKGEKSDRIILQSIHKKTSYEVIQLVRDWLEYISANKSFAIQKEIAKIQKIFRASTYGGPTVYSLLQRAWHKNIPTLYLRDERLIQYGYGKYQVRGVATTFSVDSRLDSDFTTLKDDCKAFLETCGFPTPKGRIVYTLKGALAAAETLGYPVAVKPVVGHKGIGVTANVKDDQGLQFAFLNAQSALLEGHDAIIVEQSIKGSDYRLLCVGGKFAAAVERRPPYITGDGVSTVEELIQRENQTPARLDTPTSPLGKIITDEVMEKYLGEQGVFFDTVLKDGELVYLRKVANLSSGGVSIDATKTIHPDNMILAQEIAQYLQLVCLGIDVIAEDLSVSWKEGNFGIIEINSAPGVYMHLNPAIGESVDVPGLILDYLFPPSTPSRVPIITFNRLEKEEIYQIINHILLHHPQWTIGTVSREGVWLNHSQRRVNFDYNSSVTSFLRHPRLDLLIAEYSEDIFEIEGMAYNGSNLVILDNPTPTEMALGRDLLPDGALIVKQGQSVRVQVRGSIEQYDLGEDNPFSYIFLKEITRLIE
ncbi:MAG: Glutathione biosynthesis bifunctional protein GshAB [Chroococcopsis gigantea SAG 12.99]|nr:cyanophycin synthetase [Chlorogloea purpurea SAG 13.99]MDV2999413.1 Glutathione biosynthesis bifunctional protein GshAB [Chroococcopsis gigantea SAG 12.99]